MADKDGSTKEKDHMNVQSSGHIRSHDWFAWAKMSLEPELLSGLNENSEQCAMIKTISLQVPSIYLLASIISDKCPKMRVISCRWTNAFNMVYAKLINSTTSIHGKKQSGKLVHMNRLMNVAHAAVPHTEVRRHTNGNKMRAIFSYVLEDPVSPG